MKKINNFYFSLCLAIISVSPYSVAFINYPFHVELKTTFFLNLIIGLIIYSTIYYIFLNFFFYKKKKNIFFKIIDYLFYFTIFLFSLKTFILNLGFLNIPDFAKSIFNYNILSAKGKITFIFIVLIFFISILMLNKKIKLNYEKFIYSFTLAIVILFIFYLPYNYSRLIKTGDINLTTLNLSNNNEIRRKKVIILIFDEWDSEKYFNSKEIDKSILKKISSVNFKYAVPAGRDTIYSVTAFMLGKDGKGDLHFNRKKLHYKEGDRYIEISKGNTFFSLVKNNQIAVISTGGFPYCIYLKIRHCVDKSNELTKPKLKNLTDGMTTLKSFYNFLINSYLFDNEALKSDKKTKMLVEKKIEKSKNININSRNLNMSFEAIKDDSLSLVYIHLPFPHHPSFYSKSLFEKSHKYFNENDEIINFNLTSHVIEKLFKIINSKKIDQEILTIVTSDHGLRKPDEISLVPLLVSLKNDNKSFNMKNKMSTFHLQKLIEEFYSDNIKSHNDIVNFFNNKAIIYPKLNTYDEKNQTFFKIKTK